MTWDRILSSAPVNTQAAIVTARGEQFTPAVQFTQAVHDCPPPMRPVPTHMPDMTGIAYGRIKVVGLRVKQKRTMWVCRCACGCFVERSTKAIAARADGECPTCGYTRKLREGLLRGMKNCPSDKGKDGSLKGCDE